MKKFSLLFVVVLASCSPTIPTYEVTFAGSAIQVSVAGFESSGINIVEDNNAPFDILLVKDSQLEYRAIYMKCPYDEQRLGIVAGQLVCPVCHSAFDFMGAVRTGPAANSLLRFPTELNPDQTLVRIDIEALGL